MKVAISEIEIGRRRPVNFDRVKELAKSIADVGLLNPITITKGKVLVAGMHRIDAHRILKLDEIEATMVSLSGLRAELAEIDENLVRSDLSALEQAEQIKRRKEIYEGLHPETKQGGAPGKKG